MLGSPRVRTARKKAQQARVKAKKSGKDTEYAEFYANQPLQKLKAEENENIRKARKAAQQAIEDLAVAQITGVDLNDAKEKAAIAGLVVEKLERAKRQVAQAVLTAAGEV